MRIVIADPCPFARSGMREALRGEADIEVVAAPGTGGETVARILDADVDVAVVHTDMGDMDGFTVTRMVADRASVVLRSSGDPAVDAAEALRAGAHGVVSCTSGPRVVIDALRETHHRDIFLEPAVLRRLLGPDTVGTAPGAHRPSGVDVLTDREREVLLLVGQGLDNRDIAARLTVSEGTVKTHVNRAMTKLQLPSRARLVVFCYENALITPSIRIPKEGLSKKRQLMRQKKINPGMTTAAGSLG
ncbi:response regulator transcription factor [Nocardiopsis alborubida]|uniref:Response regulator transcription factor n=1 Tax=Nocardiopsis alborubida TaxID=146802 RepID=A0A7X6RTC5_9ACTN|nr:response regulator transcription factor [Nocardiopsis alborubida]NKZ01890.1 response regulator transcription factor [Nocardiopsis alborubida]